MTVFDPITFTHKLEQVGFQRPQAEALAQEMRNAIGSLVTTEQLQAALDRQTIRLCGFLGAIMALGFTALGFFAA